MVSLGTLSSMKHTEIRHDEGESLLRKKMKKKKRS